MHVVGSSTRGAMYINRYFVRSIREPEAPAELLLVRKGGLSHTKGCRWDLALAATGLHRGFDSIFVRTSSLKPED